MRLPLILLTLLTALAALGQPAFRFHLVQNVEGFPLKDINCIVEDDKGFLWFGGPYGLYRWDGVTASLFAHDPADPASLTYGAVSHLLKSRNGGLWVGTYRGGLSFMDWETQKSKNYLRDPNIRGSLVGNMVTGLYEDRQNRLWVGTDRFALHRLDPGKEEFIAYHPPFPTDSSWTSISAGPLGEIVPDIENPDLLWLGSRFGIYEFNTATGQFRLYPFEFPVEFWYSTRHLELYGDADGVLWAGSSQNGLFAFDTKKRAWTHQQLLANAKLDQKVAINAILSYDSLHILVVSPSTQLCLLNRRSGEYTYYVNPGSQFRTGFRSRTGSWWMGATTGLILMSEHLEPFPFLLFGKLPAPALNNWQRAFALSRDGRHLYVGTLRGFGLLIWDWEKDEWQTASFHKVLDLDHTDLLIDALWVDQDDKLWIGSEDGLLERSEDPGRLSRVEGPEKGVGAFQGKHILAICSQQNKLWVGTNGQGLYSFDPATRRIDRLEAPPVISESCIVNKILEDSSGLVWVGHDQGLSVYDPKDGTWQHYQRKNSPLSHNYVMDLELDKRGFLWIATMGGGLNSIDLGQGQPWRFSLFRNQEVAGGNIIYDLVPTPQGQLWMGCESGISRFDPKAGVFVNYDLRQGMFAKIGAFTQLPNGYLASGANRGFHYFHPDSVVARISPPVPYLKEFKVFDRVRLPGTDGPTPHVELGSNENYFSFQVGALNPTVFARNSYAYMLEGRDKDWSYSGERSYFSYTHLPAGRYRFLVKVANQHGQWSAVTPLLAVRILPPFWQTPWFIALAVLVLAAVIYANYRFFRRQYQLRATQRIIDYFAASTYPNLTVEAVLWDIARNCVGSMGFEDCVIYLLDEERQVLVQKAAHGPKSPQPFKIEQPMEIRLGEGIVGTVALSGKAEMVPDTSRDKRYIPDDQVRLSELAVPILDDGKVIGVIDTEHSKKRYFQSFHLRALTAIAAVCSAKIAQATAETGILEKERQLLEMDKHLAEAQLSALRAQMNPHFLFNSLNSINWYIIKNKSKEASKYLTKFSRLIRLILDHSKCRQIALTQELEALRLYLDIEAIRFEKKFEYEIQVEESLDTEELQIPPLILQPYVENAIWHGLMHSDRPGRLLVDIRQNNGHLLCIIEDNGIGRAASEQLKRESIAPRDSKGMRITAERISLLNEKDDGQSPVQIMDLYAPTGAPTGTRVEIKLPLT